MVNNLKVSVITPAYNRGDMIRNTIESVCQQSYPNIEYIVVDGGSTDQTLEILDSYRKNGKLNYISRKDEGMYFAINEGIKMATGDIIAYLNSDDLYFPWTVQKAVESFRSNKEVDMIYGDSMVWDLIANRKYLNIYASHRRYWLATGGILCQPTVFLRRRIFDKVGYFDTNFKYLADCEFWNRINSCFDLNILKVDEIMVIECNHGNTLRETMKMRILEEKNRIMNIYNTHYKRGFLSLLKLVSYIRRELKIWKFVFRNYRNINIENMSWDNFLKNYKVHFNILNYFLCKLFHDWQKFPRFSKIEKIDISEFTTLNISNNIVKNRN